MFFFYFFSQIRLIFRDPGIVPRSDKFFRDQFDPVRHSYRERCPAMAIETTNNSLFPHRLKFCEACSIYRPPRTTHCSACDTCMERFDHHCPWLGGCVARRNYGTFLVFLISLSLLVLGTLAQSMAQLALVTLDERAASGGSTAQAIRRALQDNVPVAIVAGLTILFMWFVVGLTSPGCIPSIRKYIFKK